MNIRYAIDRARVDSGGMSIDELSRRSGVSKGSLHALRSGTANPTLSLLEKLASTMGISTSELIRLAEEESK